MKSNKKKMLLLMLVIAVCAQPAFGRNIFTVFLQDYSVMSPIDFYGLLLDQDGNPVPDAKVPYMISLPLGYRIYSCRTQADGRFEIHRGKGLMLDIQDISVKGYEYHGYQNNTKFDYQTCMTKHHVPDKDNPVVFHIRKKNPERVYLYVLGDDIKMMLDKRIPVRGYDLAHHTGGLHNELWNGCRLFCDLEMSGEFDEEARQWTVTFTAHGENAGLLPITDKKLYEAPADGYRKSVMMHLAEKEALDENRQGPITLYMYARLRDPGYYARLEICCLRSGNRVSTSEAPDPWVYIHVDETVINPYGTRSLENLFTYPRDWGKLKLDWDELGRLQDIIRDAFQKQELVPMPDFRRLGKGGRDIID